VALFAIIKGIKIKHPVDGRVMKMINPEKIFRGYGPPDLIQ
jgi:hypothetical protein